MVGLLSAREGLTCVRRTPPAASSARTDRGAQQRTASRLSDQQSRPSQPDLVERNDHASCPLSPFTSLQPVAGRIEPSVLGAEEGTDCLKRYRYGRVLSPLAKRITALIAVGAVGAVAAGCSSSKGAAPHPTAASTTARSGSSSVSTGTTSGAAPGVSVRIYQQFVDKAHAYKEFKEVFGGTALDRAGRRDQVPVRLGSNGRPRGL
jgi:hypothetical protein